MGNTLENAGPQQTKREQLKESLKKHKTEKEKLDFPVGKLSDYDDNLAKNIFMGMLNGIASLPNIPRSKYLEWRIKRVEQRLKSMDEQDAVKVAKEYGSLVQAAAKSGDDAKIDKFEKSLGVEPEK